MVCEDCRKRYFNHLKLYRDLDETLRGGAEMFGRISMTLILAPLAAIVALAVGKENVSPIVSVVMACVGIYALIRLLRRWG